MNAMELAQRCAVRILLSRFSDLDDEAVETVENTLGSSVIAIRATDFTGCSMTLILDSTDGLSAEIVSEDIPISEDEDPTNMFQAFLGDGECAVDLVIILPADVPAPAGMILSANPWASEVRPEMIPSTPRWRKGSTVGVAPSESPAAQRRDSMLHSMPSYMTTLCCSMWALISDTPLS